jgi:hypothetical protein
VVVCIVTVCIVVCIVCIVCAVVCVMCIVCIGVCIVCVHRVHRVARVHHARIGISIVLSESELSELSFCVCGLCCCVTGFMLSFHGCVPLDVCVRLPLGVARRARLTRVSSGCETL